MGRRLAGPVKLSNSGESWYARLTVRKAQRPLVGVTRLIRSLETTDYTLALRRWPAAYQALERELEGLLAGAVQADRQQRRQLRQTIQQATAAPALSDDGPHQLSNLQLTEALTGQHLDPATGKAPSETFDQVFQAVSTGKPLLYSWHELIELHSDCTKQRKGEALSASWFKQVRLAVQAAEEVAPFPDQLTSELVRALMTAMKVQGLSAKTISVKLGLLQALVQTGIYEGCLSLQTNPFHNVRFAAATSEEGRYLPFDFKTQLPLLLNEARDGWIFELLCITGLRVGELLSRDQSHIQDRMLVISKTESWKPKTKSSYRRVPLPEHLIPAVKELLPVSSPRGWEQRLVKQVRDLFNNPQLVTHSTRHTFKSLSRKIGMPTDISDEIDGHKKKDVSAISDHYGHYPDEALIKWIDAMAIEVGRLKS